MHFGRVLVLVVGLTCLAVFVSGCFGRDNRVTLGYVPMTDTGANCSHSFVVAGFHDARGEVFVGREGDMGLRPDGSEPPEWIRRTLSRELERLGCEAEAVSPDSVPGSALMVRGDVMRVWLVRDGMDHALELKVRVILSNGTQELLRKVYSGTYERAIILSDREKTQEFLARSLQDLASDISSELIAAANEALR